MTKVSNTPHAHVLVSERTNDGIARDREHWFRRANGANPEQGGAPKTRTFHGRPWMEHARERWATMTNAALAEHGRSERVNHRSFELQGVDRDPGRHFGPAAAHAATGLRIGEAAGLHVDDLDLDNGVIYVRRSVWNGQELEPKTDNAVREIDIDPTLVALLREHIGSTRGMRVFESRNGSPLSSGNIRRRVLQPLLEQLGIPKAGLHAFRHSRVTLLRRSGTPPICRNSGLVIRV